MYTDMWAFPAIRGPFFGGEGRGGGGCFRCCNSKGNIGIERKGLG